MFSQLCDYFRNSDYSIIVNKDFKRNHPTEYAALKLTDTVPKDIDERNISLAIFMNISKAFDTLDHIILIDKLAYYGIHGIALKCFTSNGTGRSQNI